MQLNANKKKAEKGIAQHMYISKPHARVHTLNSKKKKHRRECVLSVLNECNNSISYVNLSEQFEEGGYLRMNYQIDIESNLTRNGVLVIYHKTHTFDPVATNECFSEIITNSIAILMS